MMFLRPWIFCGAIWGLLMTNAVCRADVRLPAVFSNNMVLQQQQTLPVWGWGTAGEEVTVSLGEAEVTTQANDQGQWKAKLPPQKAGGPHKLVVQGRNVITITDVLIGEVWVCSGQSNMEWSVQASNNPQAEIAAAKFPEIRLFKIPRRPSATPLDDVKAQWQICSPKTIPGFTAVGYYFGRHLHQELDVPVGLIQSAWGGTRIEPWTPPVGFAESESTALQKIATQVQQRDPAGKYSHQAPCMLYNGMIHGVVPFAVRGAIWYQGESNRGDGLIYRDKMKALISGWRSIWNNDEFAFHFVQLAPFKYGGDPKMLPKIWEAQTATLEVPHTGMAVTTDIGNLKDIHPRNKQDVGKRLALSALAKTYGKKDLVYSGPMFKKFQVQGNELHLEFEHTGSGLVSRDGKDLTWFEIAGRDGKFFAAQAKISGDKVIVSSEKVAKPTAVRFAWDQLAEPNLANQEGLPAVPFRAGE